MQERSSLPTLWFYVQSRSEASRLIASHALKRKGPFLREERAPVVWKEWVKNCIEDKKLKNEAANCEDDTKRPDQLSSESVADTIYREKLLETVSFFWLRKRSLFPMTYHRKTRFSNGKRNRTVMVNHTAGEVHLTQKAYLVRCLIDYYGVRGYFDVHPHTYIFCLRSKRRGHSMLYKPENVMKQLIPDIELVKLGSIPKLWIIKPSTGSCGRGISILDLYPDNPETVEDLEGEIMKRITEMVATHKSEKSPELIYQSYINNPLLYKGYKFDYRVYLLIGSVKAPFIALYSKQGYLRVCSDPYDSNIKNRNAHITNFHVQRDHPLYDKDTDSIEGRTTRVEYKDFISYLKEVNYHQNFTEEERAAVTVLEDGELVSDHHMIETILSKRVHNCISKAVKSSISKISNHPNCGEGQFALLGVDLLLDDVGNVWLIEFTKSPAFRMQPSFLKELHTRVLTECFDIATEIESDRETLPVEEEVDPSNVQSIVNSTAWSLLDLS